MNTVITIDYLNDIDFSKDEDTYLGNWNSNNSNRVQLKDINDKDVTVSDCDKSTVEATVSFEIEGKTYKTKIANIPTRYMMVNGDFCVTEIMHEYCGNIIKDLYKLGCRFEDGKVIDFQENLV